VGGIRSSVVVVPGKRGKREKQKQWLTDNRSLIAAGSCRAPKSW